MDDGTKGSIILTCEQFDMNYQWKLVCSWRKGNTVMGGLSVATETIQIYSRRCRGDLLKLPPICHTQDLVYCNKTKEHSFMREMPGRAAYAGHVHKSDAQ